MKDKGMLLLYESIIFIIVIIGFLMLITGFYFIPIIYAGRIGWAFVFTGIVVCIFGMAIGIDFFGRCENYENKK